MIGACTTVGGLKDILKDIPDDTLFYTESSNSNVAFVFTFSGSECVVDLLEKPKTATEAILEMEQKKGVEYPYYGSNQTRRGKQGTRYL